MGKFVDKMRYIIIIVVIFGQLGLFFVLKLYFFEKFENEVNNNNLYDVFNNTQFNNTIK